MNEKFIKRNRKGIAYLLAVLMLISIVPFNMFSAKADEGDGPSGTPTDVPTVSAIWDVTGTPVDFSEITASNPAEIKYSSNYVTENRKVRFVVNYPAGASDIKLDVRLEPGLTWIDAGTTGVTVLESSEGPKDVTSIYGSSMGNGTYTYNIKDGTTTATIEIIIGRSMAVDMATILDGLKATASCTVGGDQKSGDISLAAVKLDQFSHTGYTNTKTSFQVKPGEKTASDRPIVNVINYVGGMQIPRLFEDVKFTVVASKELTYDSCVNKSSANASTSNGGYEKISENDLGDGTVEYVFEKKEFKVNIAGFNPLWIVPEQDPTKDPSNANWPVGEILRTKVTKVEWKYYGDTEYYTYSPTENYIDYLVVDPDTRNEEVVVQNNYSWTLTNYEDITDSRIVQWVGGLSINNTGIDPSLPKVIEFDFDDKIGVTDIPLRVPSGKTVDKIYYKLPGDTDWREAAVSLTGNGKHTVMLTTTAAGLSEGQYFKAVKYELDFVETVDGVERHFGIPAGVKTDGGANYNPIFGYNIGLNAENPEAISTIKVYDKVEGEGTPEHSSIATFKSKYSSTSYKNYMNINNTQKLTVISGDKISFTFSLFGANRDRGQTGHLEVNLFPTIYIRDETGLGITNVKLTNKEGEEILSKYGISVVEDHRETVVNAAGKEPIVYKIDTSTLSGLSVADGRFAAALGAYDVARTYHSLILTYDVNVPADYNDNQTTHYMANAIAVGERGKSFTESQAGSGISIGDRNDVNGNSIIGSEDNKVLSSTLNYKDINGYYRIIGKDDIAITFSAKNSSASNYENYTEGNYIQVEAGKTYDVKTTITNNSGVTTGSGVDQISYVYIPIPKKNNNWGGSNSGVTVDGTSSDDFQFSMNLVSPVTNPNVDKFEIKYATISTGEFADKEGSKVGAAIHDGAITWSDTYDSTTNMVRVAAKGLEPEVDYNIVMKLSVDSTATNQQVNIYNAMYYENLTTQDSKVYQGMYISDKVGFKVVWGSLSGIVFEDKNGNGIKDAGESGVQNIGVNIVNLDTNEAPDYDTTDENGFYKFDHLSVGRYNIVFEGYGAYDKFTVVPTDEWYEEVDLPQTENGMTNYELTGYNMGLVPKYTVNYRVAANNQIPAGFTTPANATVYGGEAFNSASVTPVTGYTFKGWYTDEAMNKPFADGSVLTSNTTLYGQWTENKYSVTYNYVAGSETPNNDGKPENKTNAKYGDSVSAPTLTKNGYEFDGWYTNEGLTGTKFVDGTTLSGNVNLYAKWTRVKGTISGQVKWSEPDGSSAWVRPDSVTVELLRNGDVCDEITLNTTNLVSPYFGFGQKEQADENGVDYVYAVRQKVVPTGYKESVSIDNLGRHIILNTYTCHTFTFVKEWDTTGAPGGAHPDSAVVYLYKDGQDFKEFTLNEANNWTANYEIPDVDYEGHVYTAGEAEVEGYKTVQDSKTTGNNITHTFKNVFDMPLIDVTGELKWENVPSTYIPPMVEVTLYKNGVATDETYTVIPSRGRAIGANMYEFVDLPKYNDDGTPVVYTVKIPASPDYATTYGVPTVDSDGNTVEDILNTCITEKIEITKKWNTTGAPEAHPTSVEIDVIRTDLAGVSELFAAVTLTEADATADGDYKVVLEAVVSDVENYIFSLKEKPVDGYEATYDAGSNVSLGVTNTYIIPKVNVEGEITWKDAPAGFTGSEVTLVLKLAGKEVGRTTVKAGDKNFKFEGLNKYNADGSVAAYDVEALPVKDFKASVNKSVDKNGNYLFAITLACTIEPERTPTPTPNPDKGPETGDDMNVTMHMIILLGCVAAIAASKKALKRAR